MGVGAKRLFAYRLPEQQREEAAAAEPEALVHVRGEEFPELPKTGNLSPRRIWSDGAVIDVADASAVRVYTYNMPDAIDARLAALTLSGVDIGPFSPLRADYASATIPPGNIATLTAVPAQPAASLQIAPADHDGDPANGSQVRLLPGLEITVTVTSAAGSRLRVYRLRLGGQAPDPITLDLRAGGDLVVVPAGAATTAAALFDGTAVTVVWQYTRASRAWDRAYLPALGRGDFPIEAGDVLWVVAPRALTVGV